VIAVAGCSAAIRPREITGAGEVVEASSRAAAEASARCIHASALAGPIRYLADDLLEGRGPGTRGDDLARGYIVSSMQLIGLEPGAPDRQWEQPVDLVGVTTIAPESWKFSVGEDQTALVPTTDFVAFSGEAVPEVEVGPAELVFAGYGIEAPEFGWDDFKGANLRGKILLLLNDDPDWDPDVFGGKRRLYYGRWTYKFESAARHGAAGAIILHTEASAGYPWKTVVTSFGGESSRLADVREPSVRVKAWVTREAAERLVRLGGHDLERLVESARSRSFRPVPLGVETSLRLESHLRQYRTANVVGLLRGRDRKLSQQVVVLTAHHDHLGTRDREDGEREIFNGAMDNASGVATLLVVANAFQSMPEPPRRSILFVATAAEEQGLLGSSWFVSHPTVPPSRMAAAINFDGGNLWGRARDVQAVGFGRSTLDQFALAAATRQHRTYDGEEFPDRGYFYRSDHFSFARAGVPSIQLKGGTTYIGRPLGWGPQQVDLWMERHYHQPTDDWDPSWDMSGLVDDARLGFDVALSVAEADEMPQWKPGDEFESARRRWLPWPAR
jgi:Zn-dependent M28 family amino/carboxypeptidase